MQGKKEKKTLSLTEIKQTDKFLELNQRSKAHKNDSAVNKATR
jgi:hypothetical protein